MGSIDVIGERFLKAKQRIFDRLFDTLNEQQREAVFTVQGPLLVLAGAGSGKTTVLTKRIAFIIRYGNAYFAEPSCTLTEKYVSAIEALAADDSADRAALDAAADSFAVDPCPAWAVLAITFTNKAAQEMKSRLATLIGGDNGESDVLAGTFHSVCLRILRRHADEEGLRSGFTIYDSDDTKRAIIACMKELGIDDKTLAPRIVQITISSAKDRLITPVEFAATVGNDYNRERISGIYDLYQRHLTAANAVDFDDIIMKTVELLRGHDEIRDYYNHRFKYVCVDEYQDTNGAQFELIRLLSSGHHNIMVVGDDDQSIYKFRGAQIENILSFEKNYEGAKVIRLEQNYRSAGNILAAANAVITNNESRMGKQLRTDREAGEKIVIKRLENQNEEARYIVNRITELALREKRKYSDFAVLYRVNAQSGGLEGVFSRSGIPYRILGGMRFFERKEVKDILAYLCVINNPSDGLRLRRIINEPKRKIGETTVSTLEAIAAVQNCSMFDVMCDAEKYPVLSKVAPKLADFVSIIKTLRGIARTERLSVLVENTIERTGYRNMILMMGESELDRLENIQELVSTALEYEQRVAENGEEATLTGFLEEIALVADIDNYDSEADAVSLMTVHSAKGLEFPVVFLPGLEEGIFPGMQSMSDPQELEEERRLAYVALTRAKDRIYISHVRERLIYGRTSHNQLSRFAKEIPEDIVNSEVLIHNRDGQSFHERNKRKPIELSGELKKAERPEQTKRERFEAGDEVQHANFGHGRILTATPIASDMLYEVVFDTVGTKKLMGAYAKLKKL